MFYLSDCGRLSGQLIFISESPALRDLRQKMNKETKIIFSGLEVKIAKLMQKGDVSL